MASFELFEIFGAQKGRRLVGVYLYPFRLFEGFDWSNPYSATAVTARAKLPDAEILVTCNGGLFLEPPSHLSDNSTIDPNASPFLDLPAKLEFEERAAAYFNSLICELALAGIVSAPATPVHISCGKLIDNHALIISGGGGREVYYDRTMGPSLQLIQGTWRIHPVHRREVLERACRLECAGILGGVSEHLPALIAGAYSLFSQRQLAEALTDSWIVVEQIFDYLWTRYLSPLDPGRRSRLEDSRTYTAGVRTELLHTIGVIDGTLYAKSNVARKHRNDLAHRAKITLDAARDCLDAMKCMIEFLCNRPIEPPLVSESVNW